MRHIKDYFSNPRDILKGFLNHTARFWPNETYIKVKYYLNSGKYLNLNTPKTFNEKLNWLKLYYHNPLLHKLVDKYEVKRIVAERIGEEYVVSCYGIWDKFDDIEWDILPKSFMLKGTLTDYVYCSDKSQINM